MNINLYLIAAMTIFTTVLSDYRNSQAEQERRLKECGRKEWLSWEEQVKRWQNAGNSGTPSNCN